MIVTVTEFAEVGLYTVATYKLNSDFMSIHHHTFINEMHRTRWPCKAVDDFHESPENVNEWELIELLYKTEV